MKNLKGEGLAGSVLPLQTLAFSAFVVVFPFRALDALAQVIGRVRLPTVVAPA